MAKAYWVSAYRKIFKPEQTAAYSKIATEAIHEGGGRVLARGKASLAHGDGFEERTVLVEFNSLGEAVAAFESAKYQEALAVLGDAVERDFRIVEGVD